MAKTKTQPAMNHDGPPLPTLYSRPSDPEAVPSWGGNKGRISHAQSLELPWNVFDGRGQLVTSRPNFAAAEAYIREWHDDWRKRRDQAAAEGR